MESTRDWYQEQPPRNNPGGGEAPKTPPDPLREVIEIKKQQAAIRALDDKGNSGEGSPEPVMIQGMKIMQSIVDNALNRVTNMTATPGVDPMVKAEMEILKSNLTQMTAQLQNPPDPIKTYRQVGEVLKEMAGEMKQSTGVQGQVSGNDLPGLLQLKQK